MMKIAICQINTTVGHFKGNESSILEGLDWAKKGGASLAVFPELATFGYPPRDLLDKPYLVEAAINSSKRIAEKTTKNLCCLFGSVLRNEAQPGHGLWNTACLAFDGKIQFHQPKTLLPTYDVFDEARHFDPASSQSPFLFKDFSFGLSVCEDIWSAFDFGGRRYYDFDPISVLKAKGAQCILNISASPFSVGRREIRRRLLSETAKQHGLPIIYCNLVGGNDELVFDGQSLVVDAAGEIVFEGKRFKEDRGLIDLQRLKPLAKLPSPSDVEEVYEALVLGLKDYARKCRFTKAIIGLSGGIDSSVVAALATKALGSRNVLGVLMPSPYSSESSVADAVQLAKNLKMAYRLIPIHDLYAAYLKTLKLDTRKKVPLAAENIQARIRGNLLMALSNQTGALVLSTGNKSELACGYCTLYGDLAGGLALLSDLPKTFVYELAYFLNREKRLLPKSILQKPPSAELRPDQKDEDSLPPYSVLDPILKAYIEEHRSVAEIIQMGFPKKTVEDVVWRVDHNEYKRRQAPPGIKVTSKAFGIGRRFPIAWEYH